MVWMFLVGGIVVGGLLWGVPGALVLGFLAWLTGLVVRSLRTPSAPVARARDPLGARMEALEKRFVAMESRLARLEGGPVAGPVTVEPPATEPAPLVAAVESGPKPKPESPAVPPSPPEPQPSAKPNFIVKWLTGGNTIARVGVVVLFFGLAFLVKYGVEHQLVPVELRVAGVAAAGIVLLAIGWRLRARRPDFALNLQGAGVAVLYLTVFGALRLYGLLPPAVAFMLLAAIAALSALLAVTQDSLALAVFAAAGGFLAPILASTGHGSHVILFSYYLVLNATIVAIAWFKAWRVLNLVGFAFSALIGVAWGLRSYRAELFCSTEFFLVVFFLVYVAIAILFARLQAVKAQRYVDGTIVFAVPLFAFGLQAGLMKDIHYGLAWSSVALAAFYVGAAGLLLRAGRERWKLLAEAFLALGAVFATVAIPLALDARWTSAAWALEGAAIVWVGMRQGRKLARAFGLLLELLAGAAYLNAYRDLPAGPPLVDAAFVGALLLAFAGLWSSRLMKREVATPVETGAAPVAFLWGLGWLLFAGMHEIHEFIDHAYRISATVPFVAAIALAFALLSRRLAWREAQWPLLALVPVLFLLALASFLTRSHPFQNFGWLAWPFAFAVHFFLLRRFEPEPQSPWFKFLHAAGVIVIAALGAREVAWIAERQTAYGTAWMLASVMVVPALVILLISSRAADTRWPVGTHATAYRLGAVSPLVIAIGFWSLYVNFAHGGRSDPLPYLPILNALDLAHVLAALALAAAWLALGRSGIEPPPAICGKPALVALGAVAFIWTNAILLRTLHQWAGVRYRFDAMAHSVLVQAALSVYWAFLALALMIVAARKAKRAIWMLGAALMAVVVAKLVLIDLSHLAGIERIVSFIGVGVLMLVIGYFSPAPPRKAEASP